MDALFPIFTAALADPFRIGLVAALVFTMLRTRAVTGTLGPLAAGLLFVAVIIPTTMGIPPGQPMWMAVVAGLAANAVILGVILAGYSLLRRARG